MLSYFISYQVTHMYMYVVHTWNLTHTLFRSHSFQFSPEQSRKLTTGTSFFYIEAKQGNINMNVHVICELPISNIQFKYLLLIVAVIVGVGIQVLDIYDVRNQDLRNSHSHGQSQIAIANRNIADRRVCFWLYYGMVWLDRGIDRMEIGIGIGTLRLRFWNAK